MRTHPAGRMRTRRPFGTLYAVPRAVHGHQGAHPATSHERAADLVSHGRWTAHRRWRIRAVPRGLKLALGTAVLVAVVTAVVMALVALLTPGPVPSWPPVVATIQHETAVACRNPDVESEPGQVNFACARGSRQVLWVFALLTSGGNPGYTDPSSGRTGLEPITPVLGGQVAASLNLHHPYQPADPVDSLEVAARAINDIVGGATVTGPSGGPVVQPGLESDPANCARYTGSPSVVSRAGFPVLCADALTSQGAAALVADVFGHWVVGAPPSLAEDAAILFANAQNPGDPRVRVILAHLPG